MTLKFISNEIKTFIQTYQGNNKDEISNILQNCSSEIEFHYPNCQFVFLCPPEHCQILYERLVDNNEFVLKTLHFMYPIRGNSEDIDNFIVKVLKINNENEKQLDKIEDSDELDDQRIPLLKDYLLRYFKQKGKDYAGWFEIFNNSILYHSKTNIGNTEILGDNITIEISPESMTYLSSLTKKSSFEESLNGIFSDLIPVKWKWILNNVNLSTFSNLENKKDEPSEEAEICFNHWLNDHNYKFFNINQSPEQFPKVFRELGLKRPDYILLDFDIYVDVKLRSYNLKFNNVTLNVSELEKFLKLSEQCKKQIYLVYTFKEIGYSTWYWINIHDIQTKPTRESINGQFKAISIKDLIPIVNERLEMRLGLK